MENLKSLDVPDSGKLKKLGIIDYGIHRNTIWVCSSFEDGKIRHFDTNQITVTINHTLNFNMKDK